MCAILFTVCNAHVGPIIARDVSGDCGENLHWNYNSASFTLTISGTGEMYNYEFSNSTPWNSFASSITNIILEDGLTSIGNHAFSNCTSLTQITIPSSVETIGDYAFEECSSLLNVTIPPNVRTIGSYAFVYCSSLKNVTILSSSVSIPYMSFCGCTLWKV